MEHSYTSIDLMLTQFVEVLGVDYEKYRNHVYRVFHNCIVLDNKEDHEEKYIIAAVFHDIGIWTNNTIDYIDPSVEQVTNFLNQTGRMDWIQEISLMIQWHHKITKYHGLHQSLVETFRKADWMDVSLGVFNYGADRARIKAVNREYPNKGFHFFLLKKIFRNIFKHPWNPLPMFKI